MTSLPEDDFSGWRSGSAVPRTEPASAVDTPTAVAPPASPPADAPMPAPEPTPRPNLGLGSFADLHAASDAAPVAPPPPTAPVAPVPPPAPPAPSASTAPPVAVDGPGAEPPSSGGGDHVADSDPSRWVVPDVSADLLPGRGSKRGRTPGARGEGTGSEPHGAPAVSWGDAAEGETSAEEATRAGQQSEERSDYFDAFRAAADRAREHAGFDEN